MHPVTLRIIPLLLAVLLCQCGAPQPPKCVSVPLASRVPAASLVATAREQWKILGNASRSSEWAAAGKNYNTAVAKLFDQLRCGPGDWNSRAALLGTRIAPPDARQTDLESIDAVFPSAQVNTRIVAKRQMTDGVGVPLVGWKKTAPVGQKRPPFYLPSGLPERYGNHAPPCAEQKWLDRFAFMEKAGDRWWPIGGGVYFLHVVKRVRGMHLVGLARAQRQAAGR